MRFFRELKRRNVYKVAVAYLAVVFVGLQAVDLLIPSTTLPAWADELLIALAIFGFPVALVLAWAFEVSPEGISRTPESEPSSSPTPFGGSSDPGPVKVLVGLGTAALAVAGGWYLMGSSLDRGVTERSIAVLPFQTIGEEETSAFTDGVHGDLLTRLSGIGDLRVTSRTSVMRYRDVERPLPAVARELGVAWILRGEVQQAGDRVRVHARLVDARRDEQIWADGYTQDLTADDLFAIQERITREIMEALEAQVSPAERRQISSRPTESLEAYRLYVRARSLLDQQTESGMRQAAAWFRRAIEEDSTYALAWSGLADALLYLAEYGYASPDSVLPWARQAAERSLELDGTAAEAHVSRALLHAVQGDGAVLLRELERAIELRPSYAQARSLLGWYYPLLGRPRAGLATAHEAVRTDPFAPEAWVNVALGYLTTGRPDSALAPARRARELQGDYAAPRFYEGLALLELGRVQEADSLLRGLELAWAPTAPRATAALVQLASDNPAPAHELLEDLSADGDALFYRGLLHAALGNEGEAFSAFERIDGWERSPRLGWPTVSLRHLYPRALGSLRAHPRYERIIADIDSSWGLNPHGSPPDSLDVSFDSQPQ